MKILFMLIFFSSMNYSSNDDDIVGKWYFDSPDDSLFILTFDKDSMIMSNWVGSELLFDVKGTYQRKRDSILVNISEINKTETYKITKLTNDSLYLEDSKGVQINYSKIDPR